MRRIYLDHNATAPVHPAVLEAMLPYLSGEYGNASSVHSFGQTARGAVERAREQVAALIGANPAEIVFTSGGTESDNMAVLGLMGSAGLGGVSDVSRSKVRPHIITSAIEHAAVLHTCQAFEKRGIDVTYLPISAEGVVDPENI